MECSFATSLLFALTAVFVQIEGGSRPLSAEMAPTSRPFFDLLEVFEDRISRRVRETELPEWTKVRDGVCVPGNFRISDKAHSLAS